MISTTMPPKEGSLPPPSHRSTPLTNSALPLSNTRLNRLIYLLVFLTSLLSAFYAYRYLQGVGMDVGSSFGIGSTAKAHVVGDSEGSAKLIEGHISALASALGVPSEDLARVISGAVRASSPEEEESGGAGFVSGVLNGVETLVGTDELM